MRTVLLLIPLGAACWAAEAYGTWKLNPARSAFSGLTQPKTLVLRVEPHPKGEVLTVDRTLDNGQSTSSSTILYLDGAARDFQGTECSGSQTSRRLDSQTVEILRQCGGGDWERLVQRLTGQGKELVVEITRQRAGRRSEERLLLEKQ
jgi:hypothetical protein